MILGVGHDEGAGARRAMSHEDTMDLVFGASLESERPTVVVRRLHAFATLAGLPSYGLLHSADPSIRLVRAAQLIEEAWELAVDGQ